jgi:hypothetical protein
MTSHKILMYSFRYAAVTERGKGTCFEENSGTAGYYRFRISDLTCELALLTA